MEYQVTFMEYPGASLEYQEALSQRSYYGIQDAFGLYAVAEINGSYTNVMGLPCMQTYKALEELVQDRL